MVASSARNILRHVAILAVAIFGMLQPVSAPAQSGDPARRGPAQLEQLVAPIALYPDSLLSQVLMASTYPLEIVEAARWSSANAQLAGDALENALQQQKWDPSVKALTAVPQTLQMMNDKLSWTQQLGDAFLAQQEDVLKAVQRLRARADANGQLKSTEQQKVTKVAAAPSAAAAPSVGAVTTGAPATPVYTIEPANPGQYYVPVYDPGVVYGDWPYADYAPFYWTPPGYVAAGALGFTAAAMAGAALWGGVDWGRNNVNIDVNRLIIHRPISRTATGANPARGGAFYRDGNVAQRFGDPNRAGARDTFRGKAETGRQGLAADTKRSNARDTKAGNAGNRSAGAKQGAKSRQSAQSKQAKTRQAGNKQAGNRNKQGASKSRQAGTRQSAQSRNQQRRDNPPSPGPVAPGRRHGQPVPCSDRRPGRAAG